jgi:hypothetical protein
MRTDIRTDTTKVKVAFPNFANAPRNEWRNIFTPHTSSWYAWGQEGHSHDYRQIVFKFPVKAYI